jgi:hypothetical protein
MDGYCSLAIKDGGRVQALQHRATTDQALVRYTFDLLQLDCEA